MALANVVAQITPLLACFLIRRPVLRALCGCLFVVEVVGLGTVMGLWNPHWLPLAAFFIDWDRLAAWAGARSRVVIRWVRTVMGRRAFAAPSALTGTAVSEGAAKAWHPTSGTWLFKAQIAWAVLFLGFFAYVGLFHKQQRRYTYPFTAFPMYSGVLAERPYGEHRPCFLLGSRWEFEADPPLPPEALRWVWRSNYAAPWDVPDLHEAVMQVKSQVEGRYGTRVSKVRVERTVFEIPRYPDYEPRPCVSGAAYTFDGGKHHTLRAKVGRDRAADPRFFIAPEPSGLVRPQFRFGFRPLTEEAARPLEGEWRDGRFYFADPGVGLFAVVAWVRDPALGPDEVCFAADVVRGRGP
jgi:hypothetical protein